MRVQGPEQHQAAADAPAGEDEQQHLLSMQAQEEGAGKTAAATTVCVWGGGGGGACQQVHCRDLQEQPDAGSWDHGAVATCGTV